MSKLIPEQQDELLNFSEFMNLERLEYLNSYVFYIFIFSTENNRNSNRWVQ